MAGGIHETESAQNVSFMMSHGYINKAYVFIGITSRRKDEERDKTIGNDDGCIFTGEVEV
jgi:hypothetical protein